MWRTIRNQWQDYQKNVKIIVGDGRQTDFWADYWFGQTNMKYMFPVFYSISLQQHDTINKMWSQQGWNRIFRRALNDWEVESFFILI